MDQPVNLHHNGDSPGVGALEGVMMELDDYDFTTLNRT